MFTAGFSLDAQVTPVDGKEAALGTLFKISRACRALARAACRDQRHRPRGARGMSGAYSDEAPPQEMGR